MKYFLLCFLLFLSKIIIGQCASQNHGVYVLYESFVDNSKLKQTIPSTQFNEEYTTIIYSYPGIKLGYSFTAWGNMGLSSGMSSWNVWGVDFGAGISYNKSLMNFKTDSDTIYTDMSFNGLFTPASSNNLVFFNYYQPGNQCKINDYGINLHIDAGTILYLGAEIDAGPSSILFTDNRTSNNQRVKSVGWFANARIQGGFSLPLPFWNCDSQKYLNMKIYGFGGWSARHYKMDWIDTDKKLKNFSTIKTQGNPIGIGFSLTYLFKNNN